MHSSALPFFPENYSEFYPKAVEIDAIVGYVAETALC